MIFRFRAELREGQDVETALVETMTHAGRSVIISGSTVAIGLLSLVLLPLPFIRSIGIAGMLIPALSVLAAITLLPALLAVLGERINSVRLLPKRWVDRGHAGGRRLGPLGAPRQPAPAAGRARRASRSSACSPWSGSQLNPNEAQLKTLPGSGDAIVGRDVLASAGISPGVMKPFDVLVENGADPATIAAKLRAVDGIAGAAAPAAWRSGDLSIVEAFPAVDGAADGIQSTIDAVNRSLEGTHGDARRDRRGRPRLRARDLRQLPVRPRLRDPADADPARARLPLDRARGQGGGAEPPLARGGVRGRRAHLPARPWRLALGHRGHAGSINGWIPLLIFAFLYGLSMDYEVFMLTRMREAYDETGSTERAIELGLARTGKLVTSGALILMFSFLVLSSGPGRREQGAGDRAGGRDHPRRDRDPRPAGARADAPDGRRELVDAALDALRAVPPP